MVILFVILTIVIAIAIEEIIAAQKRTARESIAADVPVFNKSSVYAPEGYLVSRFHTWVHPEEKAVKVGIDNFAVKTLGSIFVKNIASPGKSVNRGEEIITAEVHGQQIKFRSPVSGTIRAINNLLFNSKVNDAYGKDWGLLIEEKDGNGNLMSGSEAHHWFRKELRRLKDFLSSSSFTPEAVGVTMYDGGNIVEGVLSSLSTKTISEFEKEFLTGNDA